MTPKNAKNGIKFMEIKRLVTAKELAGILSVPVSWVYQKTCIGPEAIPMVKLGKYVRFDPDEVIAFYKDRNVVTG